MREFIELQTGQVAFISGLMSGFSLSVAAHVLRYGIRSRVAQAVFLMLLLGSLGWLATPLTVIMSFLMAGGILYALWFVLMRVAEIGEVISTG